MVVIFKEACYTQGSHAVLKSLKVLEKGSNNFKTLKTMEIYCWVLKSWKF